MQSPVKMPDLSTNDSPIRIVRWIVEPGQSVQRGQPLVEVETDKATLDVEAAVTGTLKEVRCQVDDEVEVGHVVAIIEVPDGSPGAAPVDSRHADQSDSEPPSDDSGASSSPSSAPTKTSGDQPRGMFARNRSASPPKESQSTSATLTVAQRTAGSRLQQSKQTIPHFYLQTTFNAEPIIAVRQSAGSPKPAWDAFLVLAVAKAIGRFDRFRYRLEQNQLVPAGTKAIGVGVDIDHDLMVVPVDDPAEKSVSEISGIIRQLVQRLRDGDQALRQSQPALMTVTNLGICNIETFSPIINPPEPAILGAGQVRQVPIVDDAGNIRAQHRCSLTLSVDHRLANGKYAAGFFEAIVSELESW